MYVLAGLSCPGNRKFGRRKSFHLSPWFSKSSTEIFSFLLWQEQFFCVTDVLCERQRWLYLQMCVFDKLGSRLWKEKLSYILVWFWFSTGLYVLVGAGALMTMVGFFGCCGAARESQFLLGAVSKRFQGPGSAGKSFKSICLVSLVEGSLLSKIWNVLCPFIG